MGLKYKFESFLVLSDQYFAACSPYCSMEDHPRQNNLYYAQQNPDSKLKCYLN